MINLITFLKLIVVNKSILIFFSENFCFEFRLPNRFSSLVVHMVRSRTHIRTLIYGVGKEPIFSTGKTKAHEPILFISHVIVLLQKYENMVKYTNSGLNKVAMKKLLKLKTNNFNGLLLSVSAPFVAIVMLAGMQMVCALSLNDDRSLTDFDDALVPTTGYDDNGPTDFVHLEESPDPHQQRPHVLSELDAYKNHIASTYPDSEYLEGEVSMISINYDWSNGVL